MKKLIKILRKRRAFYKNYFFKRYITYAPRPEEMLVEKGKNILVISPHIDDDAFGCGGFLIANKQNNLYCAYVRPVDETRKKEAEKAAEILNYKEIKFLNSSQNLKADAASLKEIIRAQNINLILSPFVCDNHLSHSYSFNAVLNAVSNDARPEIYFYEIWQPLSINYIFDITDIENEKIKLIKIYESQLRQKDYLKAIIGLNRYRGLFLPKSPASAEGFLKLSLKEAEFFS